MSRLRVELEEGKYTVVQHDDGKLVAHRHRDPAVWRELTGDGLVLALAQAVSKFQSEIGGLLDHPTAVRVREGGGPEDMCASLAVTVIGLRETVAQLKARVDNDGARIHAAETELMLVKQGLADNGCDLVTDTENRTWVRNRRAEKAEEQVKSLEAERQNLTKEIAKHANEADGQRMAAEAWEAKATDQQRYGEQANDELRAKHKYAVRVLEEVAKGEGVSAQIARRGLNGTLVFASMGEDMSMRLIESGRVSSTVPNVSNEPKSIPAVNAWAQADEAARMAPKILDSAVRAVLGAVEGEETQEAATRVRAALEDARRVIEFYQEIELPLRLKQAERFRGALTYIRDWSVSPPVVAYLAKEALRRSSHPWGTPPWAVLPGDERSKVPELEVHEAIRGLATPPQAPVAACKACEVGKGSHTIDCVVETAKSRLYVVLASPPGPGPTDGQFVELENEAGEGVGDVPLRKSGDRWLLGPFKRA